MDSELEAEAVKAIEHYDILREERLIKQKISRNEYPIREEEGRALRWIKFKSSQQKKPKK
jgi:hypothetical protein